MNERAGQLPESQTANRESSTSNDQLVVIIGGGPAGLTAAHQLAKQGVQSVVLEKDQIVGGISRTVSYKGYHFDIGGHRFFTKVKAVDDYWHDVLDDEFLLRQRSSRIFYNKTFFHYPLRPVNALLGLGIWTSFLVLLSYVRAHFFPIRNEKSFEDWITNRFGSRLYNIFFKNYTEKVWGIPCNQISAEWAAQRIKGLSLKSALVNALIGNRSSSKQDVIKTLIDGFHYPKRGPGMMWEKVARIVHDLGSEVRMGANVTQIKWNHTGVETVCIESDGRQEDIGGTHFISSMPIQELVRKLDPPPPSHILEAADSLKYRDFVTVAVIVDQADLFSDNWIYIHDPSVKVGRIQNFKNWSPYMVPDPSKTCLGLEYFCFEGDGFWTTQDADLVSLAKKELETLGLVQPSDVEDGVVVRMPKAYPVYDDTYPESLSTVRSFLDTLQNLQLVGRNGMHKYNNQDHSMLTSMLAVENILGAKHDLWSVNAEQEYHEQVSRTEAERGDYAVLAETQPKVPAKIAATPTSVDGALQKIFARLDKAAFATSLGTVTGALIMLLTVWLVIRNGPNPGAHLELLSQYFIGYSVTYKGAFIGFLYGFFWGFMFGWFFAYIRNLALGLYIKHVIRRNQAQSNSRVLDYI